MWKEATILHEMEVLKALLIIDDAQCFGFEFKVDNGKLYYKEPTE